MSKQNIYDNEIFFNEYKQLRKKEFTANNLIEIPALLSLLPDLKDRVILDLGCGFGEHCKLFVEMGAKKVVGIDISQKMIETANLKTNSPQIEYIQLAMEDITTLTQKFDLVVSSLALHYVEDFKGLVESINKLLDESGILVFSQEHPFVTCHSKGDRWTRDLSGEKLFANISNYGVEGQRKTDWFIENVEKYHRTFSTIINTLTTSGFRIEKILEPIPENNILTSFPEYKDTVHRPDFLVLRVKKIE